LTDRKRGNAPLPAPLEFTVLGKPTSWKRAQRNPKTGATYVDRDSETYRAIIREAVRAPMQGRPIMDCPLKLSVLAVFPIPKTWPKYRIAAAEAGLVPHTGVPDLDNIIKALKDSLKQVAFRDDRLICSYGHCDKIYSDRPRLIVRIEPHVIMPAAIPLSVASIRPVVKNDLFAGDAA
jgi:Holliday junction resolvase RusA-like endonuclease